MKASRLSPSRLWLYNLIVHNLPETRFFVFKTAFLRWCGAIVGENVRINSSAKFLGVGSLVIGSDVWIGAGDFFYAVEGARIEIGSCCDIGPQVTIITGSHKIDPVGSHIAGSGLVSSVSIGDGCWLGARSLILPGCKVAKRTMLAAGSVLTKSNEHEASLCAGVPAVEKKTYR